jgi:hypothetical protein
MRRPYKVGVIHSEFSISPLDWGLFGPEIEL